MERIGRMIHYLGLLTRNNSNQRLKQYGLTGNEGSVLMFLKHHQDVYQEQLIKELQIDKSAVTRLLQNMEAKGLVERVALARDKRFYLIKITDLGRQKQDIVDQIFEQKDVDLVAGLSESQQDELRRMLKILEANLKGGKNDE